METKNKTQNQYKVRFETYANDYGILGTYKHIGIINAKSFKGVINQITRDYIEYGNLTIKRLGEVA